MLQLSNLSKHFGGVRAVDQIDLEIHTGEIFGLIGPNGSGKSTIVNLITGLYLPTQGQVIFKEKNLTAMEQYERTANGIARTFQNIRLFGNLTVGQNLWVAQNGKIQRRKHFLSRWFKAGGEQGEDVNDLLHFSRLYSKKDVVASALSFGEMRRLELARALASYPEMLLLDEPAAGSSSEDNELLAERIIAIRDRGVTILLIEHMMDLVMGVTDRIAVLNFGKKIAEGSPAEIQENAAVQTAYLGTSEANEVAGNA